MFETASTLFTILHQFPLIETLTILFLTCITLWRKDLSSNRDYRSEKATETTCSKKYIIKPITLKRNVSSSRSLRDGSLSLIDLLRKNDVVMHIIFYLDNYSISSIAVTCKSLYEILNGDGSSIIWEQLWSNRYNAWWHQEDILKLRMYRGIAWDPSTNWGPPSQGWMVLT